MREIPTFGQNPARAYTSPAPRERSASAAKPGEGSVHSLIAALTHVNVPPCRKRYSAKSSRTRTISSLNVNRKPH